MHGLNADGDAPALSAGEVLGPSGGDTAQGEVVEERLDAGTDVLEGQARA